MRKITKRSAAIATAAVLSVGAAGGAAAWAAGWFKGHGSVTATTSEIKDLSANATLNGKLYPGKKLDAIVYVKNTNDYNVTLTGIDEVKLTQTPAPPAGDDGCTLQNSALDALLPPSPQSIKSQETLKLTVPVTMGMGASEKCAGKTLQVDFNLKGEVAPDNATTTGGNQPATP